MTSCQSCLVKNDKGRQKMTFETNIVRVNSILRFHLSCKITKN